MGRCGMGLDREWWNVGTTGRAHRFMRLSRAALAGISECGMVKMPFFLHDKGEAVKCRTCIRLEKLERERRR